ncbi:MAG: hypothetical protein J6P93_05085, partial [Alphaproteobacteria bacterium]|nr:hypothetical protein [Alphaproteobacteria bacterium]
QINIQLMAIVFIVMELSMHQQVCVVQRIANIIHGVLIFSVWMKTLVHSRVVELSNHIMAFQDAIFLKMNLYYKKSPIQ